MNPASPAPLLFWLAAFWVAAAVHARRAPAGEGTLRLPLGLVLGALLAHLGWALLHLDEVSRHPLALLDVTTGMSVLFVPLGLLLVALPAPRDERRRFLAAALGSLPLALATARVGCVVAGCCHGIASEVAWALPIGPDEQMRHPTALYEIAGLVGLATAVHFLPARLTASAVLVGMGALRLVLEPLRSPPPLGEPLLSVSLVAAGCVVTGLLLARPVEPGRRSERAEPRPRSEPTTEASATADGRRRGAESRWPGRSPSGSRREDQVAMSSLRGEEGPRPRRSGCGAQYGIPMASITATASGCSGRVGRVRPAPSRGPTRPPRGRAGPGRWPPR